MARPRISKTQAIITGRAVHDPKRFKGRAEPRGLGAIGPPPKWMSAVQRSTWAQFALELPWLNESHRAILEIASIMRARLRERDGFGNHGMNLLRQCLGQLGASPADASKVTIPEDEEIDAADAYFE
jgi:hypothetical protein